MMERNCQGKSTLFRHLALLPRGVARTVSLFSGSPQLSFLNGVAGETNHRLAYDN